MATYRRLVHVAACFVFLLLLSACEQPHGAGSNGSPLATLTPEGTPSQPSQVLTPPPGWSAILPGLQFTNTSTRGALVASHAQSGRVIGCGMSAPLSHPAPPSFVMSGDSGQTWRTFAIPDLPPDISCSVFADTAQPDTFALMLPSSEGAMMYATKDAGATWRALNPPPGDIAPTPVALVGGQLFCIMTPSGGASW
jgi:hypothetical protein